VVSLNGNIEGDVPSGSQEAVFRRRGCSTSSLEEDWAWPLGREMFLEVT
jgi:hypothetical protein